jgi:hypothetical protein
LNLNSHLDKKANAVDVQSPDPGEIPGEIELAKLVKSPIFRVYWETAIECVSSVSRPQIMNLLEIICKYGTGLARWLNLLQPKAPLDYNSLLG